MTEGYSAVCRGLRTCALLLGATLLLYTQDPAIAKPSNHQRSQGTTSEPTVKALLEMDNPRTAATMLRDKVHGDPAYKQSLLGSFSPSSPKFRVPNGSTIELEGVEQGLLAQIKQSESSKRASDRVTCILRLAMTDTWEHYYEQIADVLSLGVRLFPSRSSSWVFYCTPTSSQFVALQKAAFVSSLGVFRPEYKYSSLQQPSTTMSRVQIRGILPLGESQLKDIREMGFTITFHEGRFCSIPVRESDMPRIAELWWVWHVNMSEISTPDATLGEGQS
jgi:hypothetical protein